MTRGKAIYLINQSAQLLKCWRELSETQKQAVLKECETIEEEEEIEKIVLEVIDGQRRLF